MRKDFLKASCSWGEKKEKIEITLGIKVTIRKERKKKKSLSWEKMTWTKQVGKLCFWRETKYKRKKASKKRHLSPKLKSDIIFRTWSFWPPSNPILYIWTSKKSKWPMKEIKKRKKLIILWKCGRRKWENCNFDNLIK